MGHYCTNAPTWHPKIPLFKVKTRGPRDHPYRTAYFGERAKSTKKRDQKRGKNDGFSEKPRGVWDPIFGVKMSKMGGPQNDPKWGSPGGGSKNGVFWGKNGGLGTLKMGSGKGGQKRGRKGPEGRCIRGKKGAGGQGGPGRVPWEVLKRDLQKGSKKRKNRVRGVTRGTPKTGVFPPPSI